MASEAAMKLAEEFAGPVKSSQWFNRDQCEAMRADAVVVIAEKIDALLAAKDAEIATLKRWYERAVGGQYENAAHDMGEIKRLRVRVAELNEWIGDREALDAEIMRCRAEIAELRHELARLRDCVGAEDVELIDAVLGER